MTTEVLPVSYRPQRLTEVVGHKAVIDALRKMMVARPPRTMMFSGSPGVGKTTIALIIGKALQCSDQKLWGDPCETCLKSKEFAIHEINAGDDNGVEEMRRIAKLSQFAPMPPSLRRVIILDEAQLLTRNAQTLLLKFLEEPPPQTTWIVCTTEPIKLQAAFKRRCLHFHLKGLSIKEIETLLLRAKKHISLDKKIGPLAEKLHESGISSPALALMALEKYAAGYSPSAAVTEIGETTTDSLALCKAIGNGDWNRTRDILRKIPIEESQWIRSSLVGWFRGWLLNENSPERRVLVMGALKELTGMAPLQDSLLHAWLVAVSYQVCRILRKR